MQEADSQPTHDTVLHTGGESVLSAASEGSEDVDFEKGDAVSEKSVDFEEQDPSPASGTDLRRTNAVDSRMKAPNQGETALEHLSQAFFSMREELEEAQAVLKPSLATLNVFHDCQAKASQVCFNL